MEDLKTNTGTQTEVAPKVELTPTEKMDKALSSAHKLGGIATDARKMTFGGDYAKREFDLGESETIKINDVGDNGVDRLDWSRADTDSSVDYNFMQTRRRGSLVTEARPENTRSGWGGVVTPAPRMGQVVNVTRKDASGNEFNIKLKGKNAERAADIVRSRVARSVASQVRGKLNEQLAELDDVA